MNKNCEKDACKKNENNPAVFINDKSKDSNSQNNSSLFRRQKQRIENNQDNLYLSIFKDGSANEESNDVGGAFLIKKIKNGQI